MENNVETLEEKIKVMQAFVEGKPIEIKSNMQLDWCSWNSFYPPHFNWGYSDYRIKEEPKKKVKLYQALLYSIPGYFYFNSDMYYPDLNTVLIRYKYNTSYKVIKLLPHTEIEVEIN